MLFGLFLRLSVLFWLFYSALTCGMSIQTPSNDSLQYNFSKFLNLENADSTCRNIAISDIQKWDDVCSKNSLRFLHLNIRSVQAHVDELNTIICSLDPQPHVIGLSETWLSKAPVSNIDIKGYSFLYVPSVTGNKASGVCFYIRDSCDFCITGSYNLNLANCEDLWIELKCVNNDYINVGVVYRHPGNNVAEFTDTFNTCLTKLNGSNRKFFVMGDFNINLINTEQPAVRDYVNMLNANGTFSLITIPTHVGRHSATLLDHFYTNSGDMATQSYVLGSVITDHYPILCDMSDCFVRSTTNTRAYKRDLSKFNVEDFRDICLDKFLTNNYLSDINSNCDDDLSRFIRDFVSVIDSLAPLRPKTRRECKAKNNPWLTKGLLKSINHKNKLHKTHFVSGTDDQAVYFKKYSNVLKYVKRKAKILYFQECFTLNKNNPKNTWKTIKQIISSNHTHTTGFPSSINDRNGVLVTDKTKILNLFNNYFAEVGPNLAMNIQPCRLGSNGFKRFLKDPNDSSIFLDPTSVSEILGIISTLKVGKATPLVSTTYQLFLSNQLPTSFLPFWQDFLIFPWKKEFFPTS